MTNKSWNRVYSPSEYLFAAAHPVTHENRERYVSPSPQRETLFAKPLKYNRYAIFLLLSCLFISLGLPRLLWSQFGQPQRRTDLSPITLPGGSVVEFSSYDSKSLGAQERCSYGTDDRYIQMTRLDEGNRALDNKLTDANVSHVFKTRSGEPHGWALVAGHLDETMPFLCRSFA
jgi:hypothetical protein